MKKINSSSSGANAGFACACLAIGWMLGNACHAGGQTPPTGNTSPETQVQPPTDHVVNFDYFHNQLTPFGTWVQVSGYGLCWSPVKAIATNPDWRPYYDAGRWVQTENGLFWESAYKWGDIPFHYGRWIRDPRYGWLWVPGYIWGPAWVCWRHAERDRHIGWAPLPYGAVWTKDGWRFHDRPVANTDFDFGLREDSFVFVGEDHFHEEYPHRLKGHESEYHFHVGREQGREFYGRSIIRNEFRSDENGRPVNAGIGRERLDHIAQTSHHKIEQVHFEERHPVGDRVRLAEERSARSRLGGGQRGLEGEQFGLHPANGSQSAGSVSRVFRPPTSRMSVRSAGRSR